jgi:hypothetical protein
MTGKQLKQFAILHFIFILIISIYYISGYHSLFFESSQTDFQPQVYRDDDAEGKFSKEQMEEILIDILIPIQESQFTKQNVDDESYRQAELQYRQEVLRKSYTDIRVKNIIQAQNFNTDEAQEFLSEIEGKYNIRNLQSPEIPSPTPLQMTVEEWMMDVYLYLKHQVGEDEILSEPFFIEGKSQEDIQNQIDLYVSFANKNGIVLPPEPLLDDASNNMEEEQNKNVIIEAYLNGEIRKLQNVAQKNRISLVECIPDDEELKRSIASGDFYSPDSEMVLEKIKSCYDLLGIIYTPLPEKSNRTPTDIPPSNGDGKSKNQSMVMESFFASEIRKLHNLSELQKIGLQDCLPSEKHINDAIQSKTFSTKESQMVFNLIQKCYAKFEMTFEAPQ